jgi:alkylated DNA repair dioxygenase AlkB
MSGKEDKNEVKTRGRIPLAPEETKYWVNYQKVFDGDDSADYYSQLRKIVETVVKKVGQTKVRVPFKGYQEQPRQVAFFSQVKNEDYSYSGSKPVVNPWIDILTELEGTASEYTGERFDSALINHYRDGKDSISAHSDKDSMLTTIASFTFYPKTPTTKTLRYLIVKPKEASETTAGLRGKLPLTQGSLLIMKPGMQQLFTHQIDKNKSDSGRINVTFRQHNKEAQLLKSNQRKRGGGVNGAQKMILLRDHPKAPRSGCCSKSFCPLCLNRHTLS